VDMVTNQRAGASLSSWEIDQVADQVWSDMVNDIILKRIYLQHGIKVSNAEVVEYIKDNPLPELAREPSLQTDGRFDFEKYYALLANPQAAQLVLQLEQDARERIPTLKLFLDIASIYKLTNNELEQVFKAMEEKVKVRYIHFATDSLVADEDVSVTEDEIKQYYGDHKEDFNRPDMVDLSYIIIPLSPGSEDTAATLDSLQNIKKLLEEGENWDSVALHHSEGPLASKGGNLGWFSQGDYTDKKMVDLAFSLKPGQISPPALTDNGCQIVRVDSVREKKGKREVKARRILKNIVAGTKRTNDLRSRARALRKLMRGTETAFKEVCADSGFSVTRTELFPIGGQIPGDIETNREFLDFIYSAKAGTISYPIITLTQGKAETGKALVIAYVEDRKESGIIPPEEAASSVRRLLIMEKKKVKATEKIKKLLVNYAEFDSLAAFAQAKGIAIQTSPEFTRLTGLAGIGRSNAFIGKAFGLPLGVKSDLIEAGDDFYLLEVISRTEADMEKFEKTREQLAQQLRSQRMQTIFTLFTQELRRKTKIEDLRKLPPSDTLNKALNSAELQ